MRELVNGLPRNKNERERKKKACQSISPNRTKQEKTNWLKITMRLCCQKTRQCTPLIKTKTHTPGLMRSPMVVRLTRLLTNSQTTKGVVQCCPSAGKKRARFIKFLDKKETAIALVLLFVPSQWWACVRLEWFLWPRFVKICVTLLNSGTMWRTLDFYLRPPAVGLLVVVGMVVW